MLIGCFRSHDVVVPRPKFRQKWEIPGRGPADHGTSLSLHGRQTQKNYTNH